MIESSIKEILEPKSPKEKAIELITHEEGDRNLEACRVPTEAERPRDHGRAVPTHQFQGPPALFFKSQIEVLRCFIARQWRDPAHVQRWIHPDHRLRTVVQAHVQFCIRLPRLLLRLATPLPPPGHPYQRYDTRLHARHNLALHARGLEARCLQNVRPFLN